MSEIGSKGDLTAPKSNFRSTPESGLKSDITPGPFRANKGHAFIDDDRLWLKAKYGLPPDLNQCPLGP